MLYYYTIIFYILSENDIVMDADDKNCLIFSVNLSLMTILSIYLTLLSVGGIQYQKIHFHLYLLYNVFQIFSQCFF